MGRVLPGATWIVSGELTWKRVQKDWSTGLGKEKVRIKTLPLVHVS